MDCNWPTKSVKFFNFVVEGEKIFKDKINNRTINNIYPATETEHFQRWHGRNYQMTRMDFQISKLSRRI